jgi:ABC transport system ATP-binding/permease protein
LSYKEQRELDALPGLVARLEEEQRSISAALADGNLFSKDLARATALSQRSSQIDDELLAAMERQEALG